MKHRQIEQLTLEKYSFIELDRREKQESDTTSQCGKKISSRLPTISRQNRTHNLTI